MNYEAIITDLANKIAQLTINESILSTELREARQELEQYKNNSNNNIIYSEGDIDNE